MSAEQPHGFPVRQEEDVVADRTLRRVGVVVIVVTVAAIGVATLLLGKDQALLEGRPASRARAQGAVAPQTLGIIEQTLVEHEATGIQQRRLEEERLHQYGWVDRARGVAHIPIDEAMDLVVTENRGDDARSATGGSP
jgi:hypothetical protein